MNRYCWVEDCYRESYVKSKDLAPICTIHYMRQKRTGKPTQNLQGKTIRKKMTNIEIAAAIEENNVVLRKILEVLTKGKK